MEAPKTSSRPNTAEASPWPASGGAVDIASEDSAVPRGVGRSISSSADPDSERVAPGAPILHLHLCLPPRSPLPPPPPPPPSPPPLLSPSRYPKPSPPPVSPSHQVDIRRAKIRPSGDNNPTSSAGGEVRISETRLSEAMKKLTDAVATRYSQAPTIYRVPDELRQYGDDQKDYNPVAVYLGCFANNDKCRESKLEAYKWCCVRQLVGRHGLPVETDEARELLRGCLDAMKLLLPRVRASYFELLTDEGNENDDELALMMLLDGCLILHRLLKYVRPAQREEDDDDYTQVYGRCFVWQSVTRDLLLLENQIPFFVVKELFHLLKNEGESEELLFTGSLRLFRSLGLQMRELSLEERNNVHHLLHLFYLSVGCPKQSAPMPYRSKEPDVFLPDLTQWVPSAKELEEAGVRFRHKRNATSLLDISFHHFRGVLEIPQLRLCDSTSALLRNLIAFEQAYPDTRCDVSTYAVFMDCLVNTPEDMQILHLRGSLDNQMNGDSRFFSNICAGLHFTADNDVVTIMKNVRNYKYSRWRNCWRCFRGTISEILRFNLRSYFAE